MGFRNSLLAGHTDDPDVLVALLNSTLLRALHLATQRDGRQAMFPQLKIAHLRALPAPRDPLDRDALRTLARSAERAQTLRSERLAAFEQWLGRSAPRALFAPSGELIAGCKDAARRVKRNDALFAERYDAALESMRDAHRAFRKATRSIDAHVFAAYGVEPDEVDAPLVVG